MVKVDIIWCLPARWGGFWNAYLLYVNHALWIGSELGLSNAASAALKQVIGNQIYPPAKQREDTRLVRDFISAHGRQMKWAEGCVLSIEEIKEFGLANGLIAVQIERRVDAMKCGTATDLERFTKVRMSAGIEKLDESFRLFDYAADPTKTGIIIRCLIGKCVSNHVEESERARGEDWRNTMREHYWGSLDLMLDPDTTDQEFGRGARALARLISSGSDKLFCEKYSKYCTN